MKNTIEKQKTALKGVSVVVMIFGLLGLVGGALLIIFQSLAITKDNQVAPIIFIVLGALLALAGVVGIGLGVYWLWVSTAIKATQGSIADENIAKSGTANGKKCPKCGCTNPDNATECAVCHASLDAAPETKSE